MARSTYAPWWDTPGITTVTITPMQPNAWVRCPHRHDATFEQSDRDVNTHALRRHRYVRALIHTYSTALIAGERQPIDVTIAAVPLPDMPSDGRDGASSLMNVAHEALDGYQAFLDTTRIDLIVDVCRPVRTPGLPVAGFSGRAMILAGTFDVIAVRDDGGVGERRDQFGDRHAPGDAIVCISIAANLPAANLGDRPASYVYDRLARFAYGAEEVEIAVVVPMMGRWATAVLTDAQRETGKRICRAMAVTARSAVHHAPAGERHTNGTTART